MMLGEVSRQVLLAGYGLGWYAAVRPALFSLLDGYDAHAAAMDWVERLDGNDIAQVLLQQVHAVTFPKRPVRVGRVELPYPVILAAGFVKGWGFASHDAAMASVKRGDNIIPGWRTMPHLVGPVEFGSYTRHPRRGNPGTVIWREFEMRSTQNRVGLKNPGVEAAAAFLKDKSLPEIYGINLAVSPGVTDLDQEAQEIIESLAFFMDAGLCPAWITLNLSCPNTEDDPGGNQTDAKARRLCGAAVEFLAGRVPLWVKVGPCLAEDQYAALMRAFAEVGVAAVIATNTLPMPTAKDPTMMAGVGGGKLHQAAVDATHYLAQARQKRGYSVDIIGCGGVQNQSTVRDFLQVGASAIQYWSALVYRGPLVGAQLL